MTTEGEKKTRQWVYLVDTRGERYPVLRVTDEDIKTMQTQIKESRDVEIAGKVFFKSGFIVGLSLLYDQLFKVCAIGLRGSSHNESEK